MNNPVPPTRYMAWKDRVLQEVAVLARDPNFKAKAAAKAAAVKASGAGAAPFVDWVQVPVLTPDEAVAILTHGTIEVEDNATMLSDPTLVDVRFVGSSPQQRQQAAQARGVERATGSDVVGKDYGCLWDKSSIQGGRSPSHRTRLLTNLCEGGRHGHPLT